MEALAEGVWGLADIHENNGEIIKTIKCLESLFTAQVSFLPIIEIKTRLRISTLLLKHTHNLTHARTHLERCQLLLKSIPSCFELKFRTFSLLSQCYNLVGAIGNQKQIIIKGLELSFSSGCDGFVDKLWRCNFFAQLGNALVIEGDYTSSVDVLERGFCCAAEIYYPELQMFFATSMLHVHVIQWGDTNVVESALQRCTEVWELISPDKKQQCHGLFLYNELLHTFYLLRICDYKNASPHVDRLDAAMKRDLEQTQRVKELTSELNNIAQRLSQSDLQYRESSALYERKNQLQEQLRSVTSPTGTESLEPSYISNLRQAWGDKLELAPPPIDGEWLPKSAVYALVDLMVVVLGRPKGLIKECGRRIQSGLHTIEVELTKLGITDGTREVDLHHSSIWMAGVYLVLLMHFLENKVALDLTRSEFIEAQGKVILVICLQALVQMKMWYARFPTILQGCESIIQMLRGQYAHTLGCFSEAAFLFTEAAKLTGSKSLQAMCHVYAAVSYICIGDAESSSQALDLIGPVFSIVDSFVGVREKTAILFAYGLLLMKQHNLQEARYVLLIKLIRLATGLRISHQQLGNIQLVSQYLTVLGSLALTLHDTGQAKEILKSSLTLAKTLYDFPTQIWVLSLFTALYKELGEKGNEIENSEYAKKKEEDLQKRLADARSSILHIELIEKVKLEVQQPNDIDMKHVSAGPSMRTDLDIPESIGLTIQSTAPSSRLVDIDSVRRGKRKV
ncbi:hypothetical protein IFM89_009502 [Coptis chinensis]|uniref:Sister chromatid cohesion protein SCC4 n=1 Tax=Coptis chinensis TaxID=261450 RepID=A0A835LHG2_9MAGN|nr:hypothetical protein IFM89_009502 [Coptis chinensis]